jgi:hypothetical protein
MDSRCHGLQPHTTPRGGSEVKPLPAHASTRRLYKQGFTSKPTPHNIYIFIAKGAFSRGHLKPLAADIRLGQLRWILETAMPLRDDFRLFLNGEQIKPSKLKLTKVATWVLGKDLKRVAKLDDFKATKWMVRNKEHYGIKHPRLGIVTGYAEIYEDLLTTGKSANIERSHGFFVYVRGRLINLTDEYFGIDRNLLRHGTFSRFRMIAHIDGLDADLRSYRETIREGARTEEARELLKAVFNLARLRLESFEDR